MTGLDPPAQRAATAHESVAHLQACEECFISGAAQGCAAVDGDNVGICLTVKKYRYEFFGEVIVTTVPTGMKKSVLPGASVSLAPTPERSNLEHSDASPRVTSRCRSVKPCANCVSGSTPTEAPAMALLCIAYERLVSAIHNEGTIDNYRTLGRRLGRLMYEGRWFDPQSLMLREPLQKFVGSAITGSVTLQLRRGDDYTILDSSGPHFTYQPERLSMESGKGEFSPLDRIGQLTMRNLDIMDSREKLGVYYASGALSSVDGLGTLELESGD